MPTVKLKPEFVEVEPYGKVEVLVVPPMSPITERKHYSRASTIHPAKMSVTLCRELIRRYTYEGETVLDPMMGIGTTLVESVLLGRNSVGVELEKKFVKITKDNIKLLSKLGHSKGNAKIIRGDARKLSQLLPSQADSVVFSLPFGEAHSSSDSGVPNGCAKEVFSKRSWLKGDNPKSVDNLKYGKPDTVIFSPPYAGSDEWHEGPSSTSKIRNPKRPLSSLPRYPSTKNIGNLPCGKVDSIVTSPPYANALGKHHATSKLQKIKRDWGEYSTNPENIGNLSRGQVDAVVTSPPYEESMSPRRHRGKGGILERDKKLGLTGQYDIHENSANIGNQKGATYLSEMKKVYEQCFRVLRSGGRMVLVLKVFVRRKKIMRLDLDTLKLCNTVGFKLVDVKLFRLRSRSFWRILQLRKFGDQIKDKFLLDYEIIQVFEKPNGGDHAG